MGLDTRQGSVLSPIFFSLYLDDLLKKLRKMSLGCHISGIWYGALGYADDLILISPSRESMAQMLKTCEEYAEEHNLEFSTDPNPNKSKSKCLYFCGKENTPYPKKLTLNGEDLPFVKQATHLGHELHQNGNMNFDIQTKKARFIQDSISIRETFGFAEPSQVIKATRVYYGSMFTLWFLK